MNSSVRNNAEVSLRYICKLWFNIVVVAIFEDPTVVNVIKGESVSLNCTISGDGSYTWERRDRIEVESAKRKVPLLFLFSINV